jgi:type II secretory pathway component PulK
MNRAPERGSDRAGVALVLVLWIIVIVATVCSAVVAGTRTTTQTASNYRARVVARYAAESGVSAAVATLEENLRALGEDEARRAYLNQLDRALESDRISLGDARAAVALIDVGSRLDVNLADLTSLSALFSLFADPLEAERAARAVRAHIAGDDGASEGGPSLANARPLRSLEELADIEGVPPELARRAAELLTVDGDGSINRLTAPEAVLGVAGGDLRDEPSRILVASRGWLDGHPLTHEIQAVYAVVGGELTLVRWRERTL